VRTSQVSNIVTICEICVQEPSRLGCFGCGQTGICFSCRTERTGRTGGRPAPPVRQPDERRPRKRRAYWGTKAKPLGSRADGFAVLRLGIQFFDRPGRRETTRAKSYVILCFPTRASNANPHPARCGFAAYCRLRVWAGFDRNCRRPRRMLVMSYSPQPLPRQA
jgi:hypothetical protein